MFTEEEYMMWLTRQEGLSIKKMTMLLEYFGSAHEIFTASRTIVEATKILSEPQANRLFTTNNEYTLHGYMDELVKKNIQFVSLNHESYPDLLRHIYDPPIGLYVVGKLPDDRLPKVSVIGSRKCSQYGMTMAYKISKDLAKHNVVIVSGMARGIDSVSHKAAIDGGGLTMAVLGCGVDVCYPPENKELMKRIAENGCVISEFPPKTEPYKAHFPIRNRIISGLSQVIAVMEATGTSGTSFTVSQAQEQGRDVFALPGNVTSKFSEATNALLKDGAYVLTEAEDILFQLGICDNADETETKFKELEIQSLAPDRKLVYDCISLVPISIDELVAKTNSQIQTIQYILTMLELEAHIQRVPGQKYIRKL